MVLIGSQKTNRSIVLIGETRRSKKDWLSIKHVKSIFLHIFPSILRFFQYFDLGILEVNKHLKFSCHNISNNRQVTKIGGTNF